MMGETSAGGSSATELQQLFKATFGHPSRRSHCREKQDTDSGEVWEILAVITKMKFDYIANTTAVQLHLKQSDVPLHVQLSDEVTL